MVIVDYSEANRWRKRGTFFQGLAGLVTFLAIFTADYVILLGVIPALAGAMICKNTADDRAAEARRAAAKKLGM